MPQITVPIGSRVSQSGQNTIELQIPRTKFWVIGEKKETKLWDVYLYDPQSNYKEIIRKDKTTESFKLFSNIVLKTPFPYSGKRAESSASIKKFIKKITKKTNGINNKNNTRK